MTIREEIAQCIFTKLYPKAVWSNQENIAEKKFCMEWGNILVDNIKILAFVEGMKEGEKLAKTKTCQYLQVDSDGKGCLNTSRNCPIGHDIGDRCHRVEILK